MSARSRRFHSLSNLASRPVDRAMEFKRRTGKLTRGRRLRVESLEERRMLAVDVFVDAVSGFVTIMDESDLGDPANVQEDNNVTLSFGNFDPDGIFGVGPQDGLLITDPDGVNALTAGIFQVSPTEAFVPQNFDFGNIAIPDVQPVLTETVFIDLQDGDDTLTFAEDIASVPVVTDYDIHGGSNGAGSDVLVLNATLGVAESVQISPDTVDTDTTNVAGYAGVALEVRGYEDILYEGSAGDDDLVVELGLGVTTARVQNTTTSVTDEVVSNALPRVAFTGINSFELFGSNQPSDATFVMEALQGAANYLFRSRDEDTLTIEGHAGPDDFTVSLNAGLLQVSDGATTINTLNMLATDQLRIETLGGDDTLTIDIDGTALIDTPIFYDGGTGSDTLFTVGNSTETNIATIFTPGLQPDEGRLTYEADNAGLGLEMVIDFDNLEPVSDLINAATLLVLGNAGDNQITYSSGSAFDRGLVSVDGFETIEFQNKTELRIFGGAGDDTLVLRNLLTPTLLQAVVVIGGIGNDQIRIENASASQLLQTFGGPGDDLIDADGVVTATVIDHNGNDGNDTIIGGQNDEIITGGSGDDTFIDSPGDDDYDGGDGSDTLIFRGTVGDDIIDLFQTSDTAPFQLTLSTDLDPTTAESTETIQPAGDLPSVEQIRIEALAGDDIIRVGHADEYADPTVAANTPEQTIPFRIEGNSPNASDRLIVQDAGLGDLVIHRVGADQRSGSVSVGPLAPMDYSGIEFVDVAPLDPITAGTGTDGEGRLVVFKDDPFEANNTLPNATFLGAGPTINVDPTIDPAGIPAFGIPGDNDFFQFVAQETGTLDVQLYFEPIGELANGRPGLPADGELLVNVLDADGVMVLPIPTATDLLDPLGNKIGERITVPVVRNNTYYLRVQGDVDPAAGVTGINVYNFTAINTPAPIPELVDLQADSDTGRNDTDDITKLTTPTFNIILDDDRIDEFMNIDLNPDTVDDNAQTLVDGAGADIDYGVEVFNNAVSIGFAFYTGVGNTWQFTAADGDLNEGDFNHISAAVWIRDAADPAQIGRHELSAALQVTLDTVDPTGFFGLATDAEDGLAAESDTGVLTDAATYADRITSDTTPTFWGQAEADAVVRVYYDANGDGAVDAGDVLLGQTVATPIDGNSAFPEGEWSLTSNLDLNEIVLPGDRDGLRQLLLTAEDVAGNPMPMGGITPAADNLDIFIDTQGPQVANVTIEGVPSYDLFDPKPSVNGFTPLVNALDIDFIDLPNRLVAMNPGDPNFEYLALADNALDAGNYLLVGDHVGIIAIESVDTLLVGNINGQPASQEIVLNFFAPLPDDRYTLTISDNITDPVGNALDGESNADEPQENPEFPSGDGIPGGDFVARFTVDSRPEIGTYVAQHINLDTNGNFVWDPATAQIGGDQTNVDLSFTLDRAAAGGAVLPGGYGVHDLAFAGQFTNGNVPASGNLFDQLAAYGWSAELGARRWLIDTDSDGVVTNGTDIFTFQPNIAGFDVAAAIPIAGNFDGNSFNGDEIGLYHLGRWGRDFNRNFVIEPNEVSGQGNLFGYPIVGDFDGNGVDDFAVFRDNYFYFDLNQNFNFGPVLQWGFPGVLDRPVAADMDQDGIDDIGLFVPRNSAQPNRPQAEWYFLVSGGAVPVAGSIHTLNHPFEPVPFGNDLYAEFGDELALPIVGNFDPPVAGEATVEPTELIAGDYNRDGTVDTGDYGVWREAFGTSNPAADGNGDGTVDAADYTVWRNNLGISAAATAVGGGGGGQSQSVATPGMATGEEILAAAGQRLPSWPIDAQTSQLRQTSAILPPETAEVSQSDAKLLLLDVAYSELSDSDSPTSPAALLPQSSDESQQDAAELMDAFFAQLAALPTLN